MRAIQITEYGTNDVLHEVQLDRPTPKAGEVLIKVHAAGMNPVDYKIRGGMGVRLGLTLPMILGGEISGTVESVGDDVSDFKPGDAVHGMVKTGGFAEYAVAKATDIVPRPAGLDFVQAAAIPLAGLTAWQAIFDNGRLERGERILITGASGGVGTMAVQLAKNKGATVIATASGRNAEFVRSLGADEFIDYTAGPFEQSVRDVDVVFDAVGGDTFDRAFQTLRRGGRMVTSVAFPTEEKAKDKALALGVTAVRVFCTPNRAELTELGGLVESGRVKPYVADVVPLSDIKRAFAMSESGRTRGKIVIQVAA